MGSHYACAGVEIMSMRVPKDKRLKNHPTKSSLASLYQLGISHHEYKIDVRSRYALTTPKLEELLGVFSGIKGLRGCLILSTCNRTEFIADGGSVAPFHQVLQQFYKIDTVTVDKHFRQLAGWEVVKHLFRLASGLESMVVGESQIVGQIKQAVQLSQVAGCLSPLLSNVCQDAFKTGKRVRRQTKLSTGAVSIAATALIMAREYFGAVAHRSALIIGTGDVARDVVYNLHEKGLTKLTIINRTAQKGKRFAARVGGLFRPFDDLAGEIPKHDIIITSTAAGTVLIEAGSVPDPTGRRQLFLDLSVPPNIDARVGQIPGVKRIDLDVIQRHIKARRVARETEIPRAEAIVSEELLAFQYRQIMDLASPAIVRLREAYERIRQEELARLPKDGMEALLPILDRLSQRLVKRLVVKPLAIIRQEAQANTRSMDRILDAGRTRDGG